MAGSARVGEIGLGLFLLILIWSVVLLMAIFTCLMDRWKNYAWLGGGLSAILTVILIAIPKASPTQPGTTTEEDFVFLGRTLLLIGMGVSLAVAGVALLVQVARQPVVPLNIDQMRRHHRMSAKL